MRKSRRRLSSPEKRQSKATRDPPVSIELTQLGARHHPAAHRSRVAFAAAPPLAEADPWAAVPLPEAPARARADPFAAVRCLHPTYASARTSAAHSALPRARRPLRSRIRRPAQTSRQRTLLRGSCESLATARFIGAQRTSDKRVTMASESWRSGPGDFLRHIAGFSAPRPVCHPPRAATPPVQKVPPWHLSCG